MINVNEIIERVEENCNAHIYIDDDPEICEGWYIEEEQAIGISKFQSDEEAVASIIHEVAHHVDIAEHNHPNRREIDGEVIAHAVEHIIVKGERINGIINRIEEPIRKSYCINEHSMIDEKDIIKVEWRVRKIVGIFQ